MTLVFLPSTRAQAADLRRTGADEALRTGHTATAELRAAHDLGPSGTEAAEYAALAYAGVAALVAGDEPLRLVVAAEVAPQRVAPGAGRNLGQVQVRGLRWTEVVALFRDEVAAGEAVARARAAVRGLEVTGPGVAEALDSEEVRALLDAADLLWYDPAELDHLP